MSKEDSLHLLRFLKSIDNNTVELILWLRDFA
jgi:hypothetical protein